MADTTEMQEGAVPEAPTDKLDVSKYDKDMLAKYAKREFGVDISKRKKLVDLRAEVEALQRGEVIEKKPGKAKKQHLPSYVKHPDNGRVYAATLPLLARGDMIPCDVDGKDV